MVREIPVVDSVLLIIGGRPVRDVSVQDCVEDPLFSTAIFVVDADQKLFDVLSACMTIGRTRVLADWKLHPLLKSLDIPLFDKHQRADDGQIRFLKMGDRWERIESSLIDQGHHGGLNHIVLMVSVSDLVTTESQCLVIECTLSHFGTERAGIGFLADVKEDLTDLCGHDKVRNR